MTSTTPFRLASLTGYTVELDETPRRVPPSLVSACAELGAQLIDDDSISEDPTPSKRRPLRKQPVTEEAN